MWRRFLRTSLLGLWGCFAVHDACAQTVLHVGLYQNPPKIFSDRGLPQGIYVDVLAAIAAAEHWQIEYHSCDWAQCLGWLEHGDIDLMPDVAYTEARARVFDFHQEPVLLSWSQLYRGKVSLNSLLDLDGRRVALLRGSVQEEGLTSLLHGFNVHFVAVPVARPDEAFAAVRDGRADYAVANYLYGDYRASGFGISGTPIVFQPARLFFAARKGTHADILARIDAHLLAWQHAAPPTPYSETLRRWGGQGPRSEVPVTVQRVLYSLAAVAALLLFVSAWLRHEVRRRTRALSELNARLSGTLNAIPDLLFEFDANGCYLACHARRDDLLIATPDALLGKNVRDVLPPAASAVCLEALRTAQQQGWSAGQEIELLLDGGPSWFELSTSRAKLGGEERYVMLSRDVSERHQAQAHIRRLNRLYAALSHCNQTIVRCVTESEMFAAICQGAVEHGGFKFVWIGMLDAQDELRPVASFGDGAGCLQGVSVGGRSSAGLNDPLVRAMREDQPVWVQDYLSDPLTTAWRGHAGQFGWCGVASLPLHRMGRVVGVLNLYAGERDAFDEAAQRLLREMAQDTDFALERLRQDVERAELLLKVEASEARYRDLTESMSDVVWIVDPETWLFTYISPSVFRLRGYTAEELTHEAFAEWGEPARRDRIRSVLRQDVADFVAGVRSVHQRRIEEVELPRKDGSLVWAEVATNVTRNRETGRVEIRGVVRDVSERKRAEARIQRLAHFDHLTGLANRSLLKERFSYALDLADRQSETLAVMFLDLDHFKSVNDSLGHDLGDQLLVEVGRRIASSLRGGDIVCRLGGDEFVVVLPNTAPDGAAQVAGKLLQVVAEPCRIGGTELMTSLSIGISMFPEDGHDMDSLSRNADVAMYQAKQDGRNGFHFYTSALQARSARMVQLATELRHALERGQLSLVFQPQVAMADGQLLGAEVLLRWRHPVMGVVSPAEFIPVAERHGLIVAIGAWVMEQAVLQAQCWRQAGLPALQIAVNVSAAQFRQPDLASDIAQLVAACGFPAQLLEVELTEAVAMGDPQVVVEALRKIADQGMRIAIDDFGTGYSSLSYLKRFPVSRLKIDQSFVRDLACGEEDQAIVAAVIALARSLGLQTLAEGVETPEQWQALSVQGCDAVQGYLVSRPMAAEDFEAFAMACRRDGDRLYLPTLPVSVPAHPG